MDKLRIRIALGALTVVTAAGIGAVLAPPVIAQVRAALVRDVDTPGLAPFRAGVDYDLAYLNDQRLLTTVPAGKRLVIEHISYWSYGQTSDQLVYASLRVGQFGPIAGLIEINPVHLSASPSLYIQDGSQPVKLYFEAGEEVWVSASHVTGSTRSLQLIASGYYITP